jgi:hypothetical protein
MSTLVFPSRLFAPSSLQARLVGQAITGGASLSGEAQFADVAGGGRWVADFGEATLWTREKILAWRRFTGACDGGAAEAVVPLTDRRQQPVTGAYAGTDTIGLDTWAASVAAVPHQITATVTADAALGETSLTFTYTGPLPLLGGEFFSIEHPTWGWRLYEFIRIDSGGVGDGGSTTATFRPPLRQAITAANSPEHTLEMEWPRCLMRADGDISETVSMQRFGKATARFIEAGGPAA